MMDYRNDQVQAAVAEKVASDRYDRRAGGSPAIQPSADTLTGQMMHLDELIKGCHEILSRLTKQADALVPDNGPAEPSPANAIGKISPGPDSGPLLFRLQNRTGELHQLQSLIHRQISRIDQVL